MRHQPTELIELSIDEIDVDRRLRGDLGDIAQLAESIAELGLLQPIVITPQKRLIAGERRLQACRRLGNKRIACCIVADFTDEWELLLAEIQENTCRKPFNPSEAVSNAERLLPQAAAAARKRMVRSSEKFTDLGQSMDQVAHVVGMTRPTLAKAMKVVAAARENPGQYRRLIEQMDRTGKITPAFNELRRLQGNDPAQPRPGFTIRIDRSNNVTIVNIEDKPTLLAHRDDIIKFLREELSKPEF